MTEETRYEEQTPRKRRSNSRRSKAPLAVGIMAAVFGVVAVGLLPIVIAAPGGVIRRHSK